MEKEYFPVLLLKHAESFTFVLHSGHVTLQVPSPDDDSSKLTFSSVKISETYDNNCMK